MTKYKGNAKIEDQASQAETELKSVELLFQSLLVSVSESIRENLKKENEALKHEIEELKKTILQYDQPLPEGSSLTQEEIPPAVPKDEAPVKMKKAGNKEKECKTPKAAAAANSAVDNQSVDVGRLDFRIGHILSVEKHPDAESLYVEQIDIGEAKPRTVVSGLVKHMPPEELNGKMVVVLCNLKPAKMRGITSEAMVMCASTPDKVEALIPPEGCVPGDLVEVSGYARCPDAVLNPKKKIFETCAPDLKTDSNLVATYKGARFEVPGKGIVTTKSLPDVQIK